MNRTLGRQLAQGYVVAVVATLLLVIVAVAALLSINTAKNQVIERDAQLVIDAELGQAAVLRYALHVNRYLLTGRDANLPTAEHQTAIQDALSTLEGEVYTDGARALLERARTQMAAYLETVDAMIALRQEAADDEVAAAAQAEMYPARDAVAATLREFTEHVEGLIEEAQADADRRVALALGLLIALGLIAAATTLAVNIIVTRRVSRRVSELSEAVGAAANDVLAGTSQQLVGANEQASAVQQTVATVDELAQSADETARRAKKVADSAHRSATTAEAGRSALDESVEGMGFLQRQVEEEGMGFLQRQVEGIAASTLALAERAQSISDIIAAVDDIAEQTNLLALNAAIEAARAGEEGKGFAVVAAEVRSLAQESRAATSKVGAILEEIQQATNQAVMASEEGTKSVGEAVRRLAEAGDTISELAEAVAAATSSAEQIAAAAGQQAGATGQISEAMRDISTVMDQSLASARQAEQTARDLTDVAADISRLVRAARD